MLPGTTLIESPGLLYGVEAEVTLVLSQLFAGFVDTVNGIEAVLEAAFTMVAVCAAGTDWFWV
jgi:hypothetical protein